MKALTRTILETISTIGILLTSCNSKSVPQSGYDKYKEMNSNYIKSIGGKGDELVYSSCQYSWITGDGSLKADNLVDTVWYCISFYLNTTKSTAYVYYSHRLSTVHEVDFESYFDAYTLILEGALKGENGRLQ